MKTQAKQGFTIIEVVLVLAIAGLIFLMVFIALPALQRNQRDTQRKNDVGRTVTAINNFQSNSKGALPTTAAEIQSVEDRLRVGGDTYTDPAFGNYDLLTTAPIALPPAAGATPVIQYASGQVCGADGALTAGGSRQFAVRIMLESSQIYCASNN